MKNIWIADRGYGTGMALAFQGDASFIAKSINFAANFLLSEKSQIKQQTPSFVVINTTMDALVEALESEGFLSKMLELRGQLENPLDILEEDDYPADFEKRVEEFTRALLSASTPAQVAEAAKLDPTIGIWADDPVQVATMEREARAYAKKYAQDEVAKLTFEDFMRHVSQAPVQTHAVTEQIA